MRSEEGIEQLEKRIEALELRNRQVEGNKAWESSWARRIAVAILTYIVIGSYFTYLENQYAWVNAIVPTLGFLLSTLSLSVIRKVWERFRR